VNSVGDMTGEFKNEANLSDDEVSAVAKGLVELFANSKGNCSYREYKLERINGELVSGRLSSMPFRGCSGRCSALPKRPVACDPGVSTRHIHLKVARGCVN
jgi:hypothetical protein